MANFQGSEATEKSILQNLLIILMVFILMAEFIFYFFRQEQQFTAVGLSSMKNTFHAQITLVRSQWLMDKQPSKVKVVTSDQSGQNKINLIPVNKYGWIDVPDDDTSTNICEAIWLYTMDRPLALMKMSVGAVLINGKTSTVGHLCRFNLNEQEYFQYNSATGQVSAVND